MEKNYEKSELVIFIANAIVLFILLIALIVFLTAGKYFASLLLMICIVFSIIVFIDLLTIFDDINVVKEKKVTQSVLKNSSSDNVNGICVLYNMFISKYNDYIEAKYKNELASRKYNNYEKRIIKLPKKIEDLAIIKNIRLENLKIEESKMKKYIFSDKSILSSMNSTKRKYHSLMENIGKYANTIIPKHLEIFFDKNILICYDSKVIVFLLDKVLLIENEILKVYKYDDIKIELLHGKFKSNVNCGRNYTLLETTYYYTTKRGTPDLRYKNNPITYVYKKGILVISIGNEKYKLEDKIFRNSQKLYDAILEYQKNVISNLNLIDIISSLDEKEKEEYIKCSDKANSNIFHVNGVLEKIIKPYSKKNIIVGGYGVHTIGKEAFSTNALNVDTITLHSDIREILTRGFKDCINVSKINLSDNLSKLGFYSFENCANLKEIILPSKIVEIPYACFSGCKKLKKIYFGENISSISYFAFHNCFPVEVFFDGKIDNINDYQIETNLIRKIFIGENIEIINRKFSSLEEIYFINPLNNKIYSPNIKEIANFSFQGANIISFPFLPKLKRIGSNAFENCNHLEEIKIGKEVELIDSNAFANCKKLKRVIFEESDIELKICENAFNGCKSLSQVIINRPVNINTCAFEECINLNRLYISNKSEEKFYIGSYAFSGCKSLEEVKIFANYNIANWAFNECTNLQNIFLKSCTLFGKVFDNCNNIKNVNIYGFDETNIDLDFVCGNFAKTNYINKFLDENNEVKRGDVLYLSMSDDEEYTVPNNIKIIKSNCFTNNKIKKLIINNNVKKIEKNAFNGLYFLEEVFIDSEVELVDNNIFNSCDNMVVKCYRGSSASKYCIAHNYNKEYLSSGEKYNAKNEILSALLMNDMFDLDSISEEIKSQSIFSKVLHDLCSNYEIIEFEKDNFINLRKLKFFGISKEDIYNYCAEIYEKIREEYFTIKTLESIEINSSLVDLGFDEIFYISLLKYNEKINHMIYNNTYIFRFGEKQRITFSGFIKYLIEKHISIESDRLREILIENYNIDISIKDLKPIAKYANVYYNDIMDTFYKDYETFIKEV